MLDTLKFVQGGTLKNSNVPEMSHFAIQNGFISGYNGKLTINSPIKIDINCNPNATQLVAAISKCKADDVITMKMNPNGSLNIKSGKFKINIDCLPTSAPKSVPEGRIIEISNAQQLIDCFKTLLPFISTDGSRLWAMNLLLKGQSAYATNNIALMEYWTGTDFGDGICIPAATVKEVCRIGKVPDKIRVSEGSITFDYGNGQWLKCQLYANDWPDVYGVLSAVTENQTELSADFFDGLETLRPFMDDLQRVYLGNEIMSTTKDPTNGASYTVENLYGYDSIFQLEIFYALRKIIKTIDFSMYPKPCIFYGDNIRGVLIGMRRL